MTNEQLAAARRAMAGFPNMRVSMNGDTITPILAADRNVTGPSVDVFAGKAARDVETKLKQAFETLRDSNG